MIRSVTAGEEIMGWEPSTFQALYEQNQREVMEIGLGEDLLATALVRYMTTNPTWTGNASHLLSCLNAATEKDLRSSGNWPKSPIALRRSLTRLETSLRMSGITIARDGRSATERTITLINTNLAQPEATESDNADGEQMQGADAV